MADYSREAAITAALGGEPGDEDERKATGKMVDALLGYLAGTVETPQFDDGHGSACEVTIGFEQDPACTCGLNERRVLLAVVAAVRAELDSERTMHEQAERERDYFARLACALDDILGIELPRVGGADAHDALSVAMPGWIEKLKAIRVREAQRHVGEPPP